MNNSPQSKYIRDVTHITNSEGRPRRERAAHEQRIEQIQRELRERLPQNQNTTQNSTPNTTAIVIVNIEDDNVSEDLFEKRETRHRFIKYVYLLLCTQLLYSAGLVCFFKYYQPAFEWLKMNTGFHFLLALVVVYIVLYLMIACCEPLRKIFPLNFILLLLFTTILGMVLAIILVVTRTDMVLLALGCTGTVVIALTIFACQTKCDFTVCRAVGIMFLVVLLFMGITLFFVYNKTLHIVFASLGVLMCSFYLIYITQMIMGGKSKIQIEPDEYILGAIFLYVQVIGIFMHILQLIELSQ